MQWVTLASTHERRTTLVAAALFALALPLRLYRLGSENLWIDEVFQVLVASQPFVDIVANYSPHAEWQTRDQAPLSFLVTHFFVSGTHTEWWLRFPSAVFSAATVPLLYALARPLVGSSSALVSGLLLAASPLLVWYGQEARWYAQSVFLTVLTYVALLRAMRADTPASWGLYALAQTANVYTFVFAGCVSVAHALTVGLLDRSRVSRFVAATAAAAIASVPVAYMLAVVASRGGGSGTARPSGVMELLYTAFAFSVGFSFGPDLAYLHALPAADEIVVRYPGVLAAAAAFGLPCVVGVYALVRDRRAAAVVLPWLLVPVLMVFAAAALTGLTYEVRYVLMALPAFALVVAVGLSALRPVALRAVFALGVAVCVAVALRGFYANPRFDKEDVRGAIAAVQSKNRSADPVVVGVGQIDLAVAYYADRAGIEAVLGCPVEAPAGSFWILAGRDWTGDAEGCLRRFGGTHRGEAVQRVPGVTVYRVQASGARK